MYRAPIDHIQGTVVMANDPRNGVVDRDMVHHRYRNLIVAGRAISGERAARSAFRIQASCMAMGQAAGAMAASSVSVVSNSLLLKRFRPSRNF